MGKRVFKHIARKMLGTATLVMVALMVIGLGFTSIANAQATAT